MRPFALFIVFVGVMFVIAWLSQSDLEVVRAHGRDLITIGASALGLGLIIAAKYRSLREEKGASFNIAGMNRQERYLYFAGYLAIAGAIALAIFNAVVP